MSIAIVPFSAEFRGAVRQFNSRLQTAGSGMRLSEDPAVDMLPGSETYLALENGAVRGGYTLRPQKFSFGGQIRSIAHYRLPLSEGIVDKRFALVGSLLLRSALQKQPLLYALGMGGDQHPLPRMLKAVGFSLAPIPFYFRVAHPARFLRQIRAARGSRWRAAWMDLAACTGAGWIGLRAWQRYRTRQGPAACKPIDSFATSADDLWETAHREYAMIGLRDCQALRQLYPPSAPRFLRIQNAAGWAVLLDTQMHEDPYFGNLRVGTIVDCLARPAHAADVIRSSRCYLAQSGVDLIISNQGHPAWIDALRADGFFEGPSNFVFAASPALTALGARDWHINRGDGDGPVHL